MYREKFSCFINKETVVERNHDRRRSDSLSYECILNFNFQTIQDLLKKAQQGKTIDENDIPPKIAVSDPTKQRMGKKIYIFIYNTSDN